MKEKTKREKWKPNNAKKKKIKSETSEKKNEKK